VSRGRGFREKVSGDKQDRTWPASARIASMRSIVGP